VSVKYALPPIAPLGARLFILGSLPGDASLKAQRYYAHPTNQFWKLLGAAIGEDLHGIDYAARINLLSERKIGLWDVVAFAKRAGSLDQAIRSAGHNPIDTLLQDHPEVRAIAFNGGTAAKLGRKLIPEPAGITLIDLPSSSAAFTRPLADKAVVWSRLAEFVPAAQSGRQ
jgi:TDG/mug DNA glycosylase family protein